MMGQEVSILETLSVGIPHDLGVEEVSFDADLVRAIMALTDDETNTSHHSVPSTMRLNSGESSRDMSTPADGDELARLRAEAEKDFAQWKLTRKMARRLGRHDSVASTAAGSSFCASPAFRMH